MRILPGLNTGTEKITDFRLENEKFKISFENKTYERIWQCYYDWGAYRLMDMIIKALDTFKNIEDFEEKAEGSIGVWLNTYSGLGLFCSLLPKDVQEFLYRRHRFHEAESEMNNRTHDYEHVSKQVKTEYENIYDQSFKDLIPKCDINIDEIEKHIDIDEMSRNIRQKLVIVKISTDNKDIEIRFVLEKKKLGDKLVDKAAERMAKLHDEKDLSQLDIPKTLKDLITEKKQDERWTCSYWKDTCEDST